MWLLMQEEIDATGAEPAADAAAGNGEEVSILERADSLIQSISEGNLSQSDLMALWSGIGWPLAKAIVLILVVLVIARWLGRFATRIGKRAKIEITLARFFGNLVRYGVLVLGGLVILDTFGVKTTSFAAVIAAVGFAIGLSLSGTLSNVAAGVLLLVFRPFKVGDVVSAGGVMGKVDEIGLFTTVFDTPDNRRIIVPNGSIYGSTIENVTFHATRRVDVAVGTAYAANLDRTREVLVRAAEGVEGRLPDRDVVVYLSELGSSSIQWSVRVWAATSEFWAVKERLTRGIKVALDEAAISIPFPQMDVHVQRESE
ncbi:MAG: mechanosensitive ion channel [Phycisphaeraceae bacterium]|nr:mechanosensitive ion channel [Phycisphaeraceae bacterium]MCW5762915.1 mechanosensitive ion channel [Phycisphaeraceae bacterium]